MLTVNAHHRSSIAQDLGAMADLTDADKARLIADLRKRVTLTSSSR
jgi:hypothetical protein